MSHSARSTVIALIDEALETLALTPSSDELEAGWSERNQMLVARTLRRLRERLSDARPLQPGDVRPSLSRDLDDLGIGSNSRLADKIAHISILSNRLR
jgi:hypothetical protein